MSDTEPTTTSRRRVWWAGGVAALLLLGGVVWWVADDANSDDGAAQMTSQDPASGESPGAGDGAVEDQDGITRGTPAPGETEPTAVATPTGRGTKPVRVGLRRSVEVTDGVSVQLVRFESVRGEGRGPGESSGPSIRVTISVENDTDQDLDTEAAVLTAYFGDSDTPATDLSAPGAKNLPLTVGSGSTATGRYVFRIPPGERDDLRLDFSFSTEVPKVIYSGSM